MIGRLRGRAVAWDADGLEAAAACMDDAVAARCRTRVDSENLHGARLGGRPDVPSAGPGNFAERGPVQDFVARNLTAALVSLVLAGVAPVPASGVPDPGGGRAAPADVVRGWRITVSVEPTRVGPLAVSVQTVRPAPVNDAHPWVQHELVLENRSSRPLQFADTRRSAFLSRRHPVLIAGDEGCGYATGIPSDFELVCTLNLDAFAIDGHGSVSRTITLFKEVPGLLSLSPGRYVFRKPIRFQLGSEIPELGQGRTAVLRIAYEIEAAEA